MCIPQSVKDSLQSSRTTAVLEGFVSPDGENLIGLLSMYLLLCRVVSATFFLVVLATEVELVV